MDAAIEQSIPMTTGQMVYRLQEQAKLIQRLTRTMQFREARIDELVRMVHDLRTTIAKRQPEGPRATVEESPGYQAHVPKKRIPKAVIGRA